MSNTAHKLKPYLLLLLIVLIAYLPLSTFYFGMKNDAFSDNFPNKYFFTASLRSGYLPLWNPYLNFGFPIYADPGFAFWSPITWLVGCTIGYSAYTLTAEVLLYIYLAGVCMFSLGKFLQFTTKTSIAIACMYMCSGFFSGCLQYINFLTSAAFLPLLVLCFLRLQQQPSYRNAFWCGCAYYLILCGGHPAIPIATAYFIAIFFVLLIIFNGSLRLNWKRLILFNSIAILVAVLLFLPAIYSCVNVWPQYARNNPAEQSLFTSTGFTFRSYVSYLFPFSTISKDFLSNDVAMRNGYFSLAGITLITYALLRKNKKALLFILLGLLMLIIAAGGSMKTSIYGNFPGLNFIRYNGEFRVFSILSFCIAAGYGLQELLKTKFTSVLYQKVLAAVIAIAAIVFVACLFTTDFGFFSAVPASSSAIEKVKWILSNISFTTTLLLSSFLALGTAIALYLPGKRPLNYFLFIVIADLMLNSILYLPVTGVGKVKLAEIQKIYDNNPPGIPIPALVPVNKIDTLDAVTTGLVGDLTYYNKLVGTTKLTDYPSYFVTTDQFFNSDVKNEVNKNPFIFLKKAKENRTDSEIKIEKFEPTFLRVTVNLKQADTLVVLQNNYKYWNIKVNNRPVAAATTYYAFIGIPLNAGETKIEIVYKDVLLLPLTITALAFFAVNCVVLLCRRPTTSLSKQNQ